MVKCVLVPIFVSSLLIAAACGGDDSAQSEPHHGGHPLSYWIDGLREGSEREGNAVDALSRMGTDAVDPLIAVLRESDDTSQRVRAAGTLGNIGSGVAWNGEGEPFSGPPVSDAVAVRILVALQEVVDAGDSHLAGTAEAAIEQIRGARESRATPGTGSFDDWYRENKADIKALTSAPNVPSWAKVSPEQIAEAKKHGVPVAFENDLGMRFVLIPAGTFVMGSPEDEEGRSDNEAQHRVTITKPYYMQITEVTNGQWLQLMRSLPSMEQDADDSRPVDNISHYAAKAFVKALHKRGDGYSYGLPTEAEWEYACRAGTESAFSAGATIDSTHAKFGDRDGSTVSVASYDPNRWGLYDMHGNVVEHCDGWLAPYPAEDVADPKGPATGQQVVLRGGSWAHAAKWVRSASRHGAIARDEYHVAGFRLISPLPAPQDGK